MHAPPALLVDQAPALEPTMCAGPSMHGLHHKLQPSRASNTRPKPTTTCFSTHLTSRKLHHREKRQEFTHSSVRRLAPVSVTPQSQPPVSPLSCVTKFPVHHTISHRVPQFRPRVRTPHEYTNNPCSPGHIGMITFDTWVWRTTPSFEYGEALLLWRYYWRRQTLVSRAR